MRTIREWQQMLGTQQISACALLEASLAAIHADSRHYGNAYTAIDHTAARAAAATSDTLRARGYVPSPLAGIPVTVKDLFDVKGQVTTAGSRVLRGGEPAARDGIAIARLRDAGAVFVGRTNMSEFAFSGLGLNPHYGTPRNPHDPARIVGGSSSGAALSVARGHAVWALGTDTGGSVRIPAAFCGLTAFKPTAARVPLDGLLPLSTTFDSVGPIARSVDCCVLADAVLSAQTLDTAARPLDSLRFGVTYDYVGDDLDHEVRIAFDYAIRQLRAAGATVEHFAFPSLADLMLHAPPAGITAAQAWAWHRRHVAANAGAYDPRVLKRLRKGEHLSAADYLDLLAARERFVQDARARLARFDAWLMPTVAMVAPRLEDIEPADEHFFAANARALRLASIVNVMDGCALTLPCHGEGALPVGLSIVGSAFADARVLAIGRSVEGVLRDGKLGGWPAFWPETAADAT
ncbi:amidase [Paraburkholderia silviterrae]|uniref:Amidase n=1 Tax=Paraburkholderia silviterrae TaxID=2528715 RepID=A0A4R5LZ61_9BURK|nr:amidase [Paraburkholderia silviterrae]TDG17745.1 amidase [Paraburkholderia silviterrae]